MRKMILFPLSIATFILTFGSCKKNDNVAVSKSPDYTSLVHTALKDKVSVEEKKGVYIAFGDMYMLRCVKHPTAVCYWITVSNSGTHTVVMDGDIEGNYTATPEYPEDKIQMHINTPGGERIIETTEIMQTVDENGTATVTYK